jgi:hypothetical protein
MTEYDETNRGKLWKNKKKDPNSPDYKETLPDFTGSLNVDGAEFFLDAWKRKLDANPNAPALTFKVKRKDVQQPRSVPTAFQKRSIIPDDGDVPF